MDREPPFRLFTRSDFDGLVSATLLKDIFDLKEIIFVHPKDVQDGLVDITNTDVTANLPYVEEAYLAFDHHTSELLRVKGKRQNHVIDPDAKSTARIIYDYYGGKKKFSNISREIMEAVDKADSAQFTREEVLHPTGWTLLNFIMDSRTGLGRFKDFRISNYRLMHDLIDYCHDHTIEEILDLPDVKERKELYFHFEEDFKKQIKRCSRVKGNVLTVDLRDEEQILPGNRFIKYGLFDACSISIQIVWGKNKERTVFSVGKSIFNRTSTVDVGAVMLTYNGGGHKNAGGCQVANEDAEKVLGELIRALQDDKEKGDVK